MFLIPVLGRHRHCLGSMASPRSHREKTKVGSVRREKALATKAKFSSVTHRIRKRSDSHKLSSESVLCSLAHSCPQT